MLKFLKETTEFDIKASIFVFFYIVAGIATFIITIGGTFLIVGYLIKWFGGPHITIGQ